MTDIHARTEELKRAADRQKQADKEEEKRNAIGEETRSTGPSTLTGRMRRHLFRPQDTMMAMMTRHSIDLSAVFLASNGKPFFNFVKEDLWHSLTRALHVSSSNHDSAQHVELRDTEDYSFIYHTTMIGSAVKQQLDQEVAEVRTLEKRCQHHYDAGQYGPFSEHKEIGHLRDIYQMRVHPLTGDIAFSQSRVQNLQETLRCTDGSCPVTVFSAIPTSSLRGIHVKAADPNSEHATKITTSDQAVDKATAPPVRVPPPQLNFVQ